MLPRVASRVDRFGTLDLVDQVDVSEEVLTAADLLPADTEFLEDLVLLRFRDRRAVDVDRGRGRSLPSRLPF